MRNATGIPETDAAAVPADELPARSTTAPQSPNRTPRKAARTRRKPQLHGQHLDRKGRAKKYQRLKSLSERANKKAVVLEALERRESKADALCQVLRGLRMPVARELSEASVVQRRLQYLRIPTPDVALARTTPRAAQLHAAKAFSARAACAAILAAFALPLLVALFTDVVPQPNPLSRQNVALVAVRQPALESMLRQPTHLSTQVRNSTPAVKRSVVRRPATLLKARQQPRALAPAEEVVAVHSRQRDQWQLSAPYAQSAILHPKRPQNVVLALPSPVQAIPQDIVAQADQAAGFSVTAQPVGPHLINVGWTPLKAPNAIAGYKVYRSSGEGEANQLVADLPADRSNWRDTSIDPGSRYRYVVSADAPDQDIHASADTVTAPAELPPADVSVLAGKGMFLYFSSVAGDPHDYRKYDPDAVIAEAQKAGIRVIELRMARGTSFMAETPAARAWLNHIIDAASTAGIKLVAWTVPRRVTTEDVLQSVSAAEYTTPSGNGFVGLALDLETGARYMGDGAAAKESMVRYIDAVRSAVGPHYLLIATVASPLMGHLTNADFPYARIAAYADVMQPMEYWHYFDESVHHAYAHREVAGVAAATVLRTRALAGRDIPVDIAGQSVDLEGTGAPSGREISWSLDAAKSVGAIGETFFDWAGTQPDAWAAIQAFEW